MTFWTTLLSELCGIYVLI